VLTGLLIVNGGIIVVLLLRPKQLRKSEDGAH